MGLIAEALLVDCFTTTRPVILSTTKLPLMGPGVLECWAFARDPPLFKFRDIGLCDDFFVVYCCDTPTRLCVGEWVPDICCRLKRSYLASYALGLLF